MAHRNVSVVLIVDGGGGVSLEVVLGGVRRGWVVGGEAGNILNWAEILKIEGQIGGIVADEREIWRGLHVGIEILQIGN